MTVPGRQNSYIHFLIKGLKMDKESKEEIVHTITNGRTISTADMDHIEREKMIKHLQSLGQPTDNPSNKMRRKILSICHDMSWETPSGQIDWPRLNEYLNKYGYLHKPLNGYTEKELPVLVTQFENLQRHATRKV